MIFKCTENSEKWSKISVRTSCLNIAHSICSKCQKNAELARDFAKIAFQPFWQMSNKYFKPLWNLSNKSTVALCAAVCVFYRSVSRRPKNGSYVMWPNKSRCQLPTQCQATRCPKLQKVTAKILGKRNSWLKLRDAFINYVDTLYCLNMV